MRPIVAAAVLGLVALQLRGSLAELAVAALMIAPAFLLVRGTWRMAGDLGRLGRRPRR